MPTHTTRQKKNIVVKLWYRWKRMFELGKANAISYCSTFETFCLGSLIKILGTVSVVVLSLYASFVVVIASRGIGYPWKCVWLESCQLESNVVHIHSWNPYAFTYHTYMHNISYVDIHQVNKKRDVCYRTYKRHPLNELISLQLPFWLISFEVWTGNEFIRHAFQKCNRNIDWVFVWNRACVHSLCNVLKPNCIQNRKENSVLIVLLLFYLFKSIKQFIFNIEVYLRGLVRI